MPSEEMPERIWLDAHSYNGAVGFAHPEQHKRDGWPTYIRADLCASGQQVRAKILELADLIDQNITENDLCQHRLLLNGEVYTGPAVDWSHRVLTGLRDLMRKHAALTPAPQPEGQSHRSFPDAADGRPMPPMGEDLMAAGLSGEDARFVALQLAQNGLMLVPATPTAQEAVPVAWRSVERKFYRSEWPPAPQPDTCWRCAGTGLVLGYSGEPGLCSTCKGDTVTVQQPSAATPPQPSETVAEAINAVLKWENKLVRSDDDLKERNAAFAALRALKGEDQ